MKHQLKWMSIILVGVLIMLACGPFGNQAEEAAENLEATAQAAAQEAQENVEKAAEEVQEAAKEVEQQAQKAAEEAQEKAADAAKAAEAEAEKAKEAVEEKAAEAVGEKAAEADSEVVELQTQNIQSTLQNLSSYRWQFNLEYDGQNQDGQAEQGQVSILIEAIKEPPAVHMEMQLEGQPAEELGESASIQMYSLEGMTYVQNPEDGTWISFPAEGGLEEFFDQGFFNPEEIFELPENARRKLLPETVNGISTWHYTFTEADITEENFTVEEAKGDIWVAQDGNYPVKFELEMNGSGTGQAVEDFFASGTMKMSYELLDINQSFTIDLPEEAANAEGFGDLFGGSDDPAEISYPLLADAEIDFSMEGLVSYKTASTVNEAVEFYKTELANDGWENDTESEFISAESALMVFNKEGAELSLIIALEADGSTSVLLTEQEP